MLGLHPCSWTLRDVQMGHSMSVRRQVRCSWFLFRVSGAILVAWLAIGWHPVSAQYRQPATVTSVVDGDTIKVRLDSGQTITVRLIGMDTPEIHHPTKPVQCFGQEAAAR